MKQERAYTGRIARFTGQLNLLDITLANPEAQPVNMTSGLPAINTKVTVTVTWDEPERPLEKGDTVALRSAESVPLRVLGVSGAYAWVIRREESDDHMPWTIDLKDLKRVPE